LNSANTASSAQEISTSDWIVGAGMAIAPALADASSGQNVEVRAGTFEEDLTFDKALNINGPNAGTAHDGARSAEAIIDGEHTLSASGAVMLDGLQFLSNNSAQTSTIYITTAAGHTIQNNQFVSSIAGGDTGGQNDLALYTAVLASGTMTISENSFSGDGSFSDGDRYSSAAWGRGIWLNGGGAAVTVSNNAFTNCRTGMNLENYVNSASSIASNSFVDCGTGMALGVPTAGEITSITGNSFQDVDTDINARNLTADITWDLAATANAAVPGNSTYYSDLGFIPGNNPGDLDDPIGNLAYLSGSGADNLTFGADDNNVTGDYGGGANDVLDGGDGTDLVIYADDLANLTLTTDGSGVVTIVSPTEGTDLTENFEFIQANGTVYPLTNGCTDAAACNYDAAATVDDGSCAEVDVCGVCGGGGADSEAPVISGMPADISTGNDAGNCSAAVTWTAPTATDNCVLDSFTSSANPGDSFPVGSTLVSYTASDLNGNTTTATFTVTITDTEAPAIDAGGGSGEGYALGPISDSGSGTIQGGWTGGAQAYFQNDGTDDETVTAAEANSGSNSWFFTDAYGNPGQGSPHAPSLGLPSGTGPGTVFTLEFYFKAEATADGDASVHKIYQGTYAGDDRTGININIENNTDASGNGLNIFTYSYDAGSFPVTTIASNLDRNVWHKVNVTYTIDASGDPSLDTVVYSVDDGAGVSANTWMNVWRLDNGFTQSYGDNIAWGGAGNASGFYYDDITYSSDFDGSSQTIDFEESAGSGLQDITLTNDAGVCGAVATWDDLTAADNCSVTSFTSTHDSGDTFAVGTTTVTYTAADAAGNSSAVSFTVTVSDNEDPSISSTPADISVSSDAGDCSAAVTWTAPSASDNCAVASLTSDANPGDTFPVGTTAVSYTATDLSGNTTTSTFNVTVDGGGDADGDELCDNADNCTDSEANNFDDAANGACVFNVTNTTAGTGFRTIQDAIDAASAGDVLQLLAVTFEEDLALNKGVTINGPNAGIAHDGTRGAEAIIDGEHNLSAAAALTLDGIEFLSNNPAQTSTIFITTAAGHAIQNNRFVSSVPGGNTDDKALYTAVLASGSMTISGNSFSGDGSFVDGDRYSSAAWGRGIWFNGGGAAVTISDNEFTNCRTGMNLEDYANSACSVDGNT
ncbi:MAG: HYR domain-containing protein, partial [Flavobacteriales bacterium]|nr:HYR domain-containing protein [Flavobacteriales bacterium]